MRLSQRKDLWLEKEDMDAKSAEWKQVSCKLWKRGFVNKLEVGQSFKFHPRRWHEVQPGSGSRVVRVIYTECVNKLHYADKDTMEFEVITMEFKVIV